MIAVCESQDFSARAAKIWSESERDVFVCFLAEYPTAGSIIPGIGGIRKIRWGRGGIGKRGGARIIYYCCDDDLPIFLITMFTKNEKDDLPASVKPALRAFVSEIKQHRPKRSH